MRPRTFAGDGEAPRNASRPKHHVTQTAGRGTPCLVVFSSLHLTTYAQPDSGQTLRIFASACSSREEVYSAFTATQNAEKMKNALRKCGQPVTPECTIWMMKGEF